MFIKEFTVNAATFSRPVGGRINEVPLYFHYEIEMDRFHRHDCSVLLITALSPPRKFKHDRKLESIVNMFFHAFYVSKTRHIKPGRKRNSEAEESITALLRKP